jgi:hypothetical protein
MPLFEWNGDPGTSVLSDRFWVYWAVTLPLTAVILFIWLTWLVWTTKNRRDADNRARFGYLDLEKQTKREIKKGASSHRVDVEEAVAPVERVPGEVLT